MLSVTDNSHVARGDTNSVAAFSPASEINLNLRVPNCPRRAPYTSSSVQTLKLTSVLGPKVWVIGTSAASRP